MLLKLIGDVGVGARVGSRWSSGWRRGPCGFGANLGGVGVGVMRM